MIAPLAWFKLAAYARSHRILQPVGGLLAILVVLYSTRAPAGQELAAYTDSAALLLVVFGWTARSLLDTEPDTQRLISMTAAGGPYREITAGLAAAFAVGLSLVALAVTVPLAIGFSAFPITEALLAGTAIHLLSLVVGTTLGALTTRPLLPSPATSIMALLGGYLAMLLASLSPLAWALPVPVLAWMRAANDGLLLADLPRFTAQALVWALLGGLAYVRLRLRRP